MPIIYNISNDSKDKLNNYFSKNYDYMQWFYKLKTYDIVLENIEKFVNEFRDEELKKENIEQYKLALQAEVVFAFFHIAEALFSLMICMRNSQLPWLDMKTIRFEKICKYVRNEVITGNITDDDIRFLFYNGIFGDQAKKKEIVQSIKFIKEYLKKMGTYFLDNEVYNEYKHGSRVMTAKSSLNIAPANIEKTKPILSMTGNAHVFLQTEQIRKVGRKEYHRILQKTRSFDYKLYLRLCVYTFRLINNLFETRKLRPKIKEGDQVNISTYHEEDITKIFEYNPEERFEFSFSYP